MTLVRYSVISVTIPWFYLFRLTHFLNVSQILTCYLTLILDVFEMIPKNIAFVKTSRGVTDFSRKNYFLSLLIKVRMKAHLPQKSPLFYSVKISYVLRLQLLSHG